MSDCCNKHNKCNNEVHDGGCEHDTGCEGQKDFFGWWRKKAEEQPVTFTLQEVIDLLEEVKEFNAGAIDKYLSRHVDKVLENKLNQNKSE